MAAQRSANFLKKAAAALGGCVLLLLLARAVPGRAQAQPAVEPGSTAGQRNLAIYLPGVYFAQLEQKLELGNELTTYLAQRLGDRHRYNARVYANADDLRTDADAGRVALALVESPFVASHLGKLVPVSVNAVGGETETRLDLLVTDALRALPDLRRSQLTSPAVGMLEAPQPFFLNFVFEGELPLGRDQLAPARDVASALSLATLKKADAVMLYEDDVALGKQAGLRLLYQTAPLPRPTLAAYEKALPPAELQRLRDALAQFRGQVHPTLKTFRSTTEAPYQALRARIEKKPRRIAPLVELPDDASPWPQPRAPSPQPAQVPLKAFAPAVD